MSARVKSQASRLRVGGPPPLEYEQITLANADKLGHGLPNGEVLDLVPLSRRAVLDVTPVAPLLQGVALPPLPSDLDRHVVGYVRHEVVPVGEEAREAGGHEVEAVS